MGKAAAAGIASGLTKHGMDPATPLALVENASLPDERIITTRLDLLPIAARALGNGPALILIGAAMAGGHAEPVAAYGAASKAVLAPA